MFRRGGQRHRERRVSGPAEPGERAGSGGGGGRRRSTAGPEASESRVILQLRQHGPPQQPQETQEQEQTQVPLGILTECR